MNARRKKQIAAIEVQLDTIETKLIELKEAEEAASDEDSDESEHLNSAIDSLAEARSALEEISK